MGKNENSSQVDRPHTTRVQILDLPDPVTMGAEFKIRVGADCAAGCDLAGTRILVYDHESVQVATATLSKTVLREGTALATAELVLHAPKTTGRSTWTAKCKPDDEHVESACTFHVGIARPTDHTLSVHVVDGDTHAPIPNARATARARAYSGVTHEGFSDAAGLARIGLPADEYLVYVRTDDKECSLPVIRVDGDVIVQATLWPVVPTP